MEDLHMLKSMTISPACKHAWPSMHRVLAAWKTVKEGKIGQVRHECTKSYSFSETGLHPRYIKGVIPWVGSHAIDGFIG